MINQNNAYGWLSNPSNQTNIQAGLYTAIPTPTINVVRANTQNTQPINNYTPYLYNNMGYYYQSSIDSVYNSTMYNILQVPQETSSIIVTDLTGKTHTIEITSLLKYIDEQELVKSNELVRQSYERYQVAIKLVRSDDNGDTEI